MVSPVMFENGVDGARINISDPDQWEITFEKDNKVYAIAIIVLSIGSAIIRLTMLNHLAPLVQIT